VKIRHRRVQIYGIRGSDFHILSFWLDTAYSAHL